MTFNDLDPVLDSWCKRRGLFKHTRMQDSEIRGIEVVDDAGDIYQMSVIPTDHGSTVIVGISDRRKERDEYRTSLGILEKTLEDAYSKIENWIAMRGHTRTAL